VVAGYVLPPKLLSGRKDCNLFRMRVAGWFEVKIPLALLSGVGRFFSVRAAIMSDSKTSH
jgi:hypothetical protein